jgi:hypothetical protein
MMPRGNRAGAVDSNRESQRERHSSSLTVQFSSGADPGRYQIRLQAFQRHRSPQGAELVGLYQILTPVPPKAQHHTLRAALSSVCLPDGGERS